MSTSAVTSTTVTNRMLLPAIGIATMLAPLNSTMIAVALPDIQRAFDASVPSTAWLVTLYLVAMAVGQPVGGRLGDLHGRKRIFLLGLAWFAVASAGCAFAPSLPLLIIFRTQQALAGTLIFPNGTAMIREVIPTERRGMAFGLIGLAAGVAAASGPPVGGVLVHAFGWSAIFWANLPMVGLAVVLGLRSLPISIRTVKGRTHFDVTGTLLFALALAAVILIPTLLRLERSGLAALAGCAGLLVGWGFVRWERRVTMPVMDLGLFSRSHFAASCASIGLSNLVMYTTLLALPLYLEGVRDLSIRATGLILAAMSAFGAFSTPLGGRLSDRHGRWLPSVTGALLLFAGTSTLAYGVHRDGTELIVVALTIMGLGLGIAGAPVQTAAVEAVPAAVTGSAAGIFSTARYIGSVIGASVLAIAFVVQPGTGDTNRFVILFSGLALVAAISILANNRIADRRAPQQTA